MLLEPEEHGEGVIRGGWRLRPILVKDFLVLPGPWMLETAYIGT